MSEDGPETQPAGWYYAQGDPPGTQRYWNGERWAGGPQPIPGSTRASSTDVAEPTARIGARVIDLGIWFLISYLALILFSEPRISRPTNSAFLGLFLGTMVGVAGIVAYEALMVGLRGRTVGKMALGLQVTRSDGTPVDVKDGLVRILPYVIPAMVGALLGNLWVTLLLTGFVAMVALFQLLTDDLRQTFWDKLANSIVVERR